jgi:long-chain acyl-CoA synthetase
MKREIEMQGTIKAVKGNNARTSIAEVLAQRSREKPDRPALWHKDGQGEWVALCWKEYWDQVSRLAGVMEQHGLQPGDKVAVILPTSVEWELIDKAALYRGLVVVGIEPHMAWEDMVRVIEETRPRALFVADRAMAVKLSGTEQGVPLPLGEDVPEGQVRGLLSSIKLAVCLERCYDLYEPFIDWATLEQEMVGQTNAQNPFPVTADSPASYILTSGTTGDPKGIVYTQGQLLLAAQSILAAMGPFEKGERTLAWLPMASPFQRNMNLAALLAGIPLYFQSDPKQLLQTIKEVRPTLLIGVPRVYEKIYLGVLEKLGRLPLGMGRIMKALLNGAMSLAPRSSKERDRLSWPRRAGLTMLRRLFRPVVKLLGGRMRFMVTGSAPCREDVLLFFHALGIPLLEAYGVSECAVPLSLNRPNDYKIGTVGRPLMSNNLNVEGWEIEVDGPAVFNGYENQSTHTNLTSGKYLSTGDVGELDEEGYLRLVGRKGDLIKTSTGRKIAPAAIEQKLVKYLGAEQAMVVGEGRAHLAAIVCYDGGMTAEQKESFEKNLAKMNEGLADHERVRRCVVLDRLFSLERGELTRTLKLRRAHIEKIHGEAL